MSRSDNAFVFTVWICIIGITMLVKNVSKMQYLDKLCILMQTWSKSMKNNQGLKRYQNSFYECCHFEYLLRLYYVIKPSLNMQT